VGTNNIRLKSSENEFVFELFGRLVFVISEAKIEAKAKLNKPSL